MQILLQTYHLSLSKEDKYDPFFPYHWGKKPCFVQQMLASSLKL